MSDDWKPRKLSPVEVDEARRVIRMQADTRPADGKIGPAGAWARATGVQVLGRNAHERIGEHGIFRSTQ